jgi:hypothetical protein
MASAMLVTAAVCVVMQILISPTTSDSPRRINVRYVDDNGRAFWETDTPLSLVRTPATPYDWLRRPPRVFRSSAQQMTIAPPELQILSATPGRFKLRIRSSRGAPRIALYFRAPSFQTLLVNGSPLPAQTPRFREFLAPGWHRAAVRGAQEAHVEILLKRDEPIDAILVDTAPGLPPASAALVAARNASVAVPTDDGDTTTVMRRVRIAASPPTPPRAWSAGVLTGGGYSGGGKGSVFVRSDDTTSCPALLSPAVAAAHPETWKTAYFLPAFSGRTDQFHYVLTLQVTKSDGKKAKYQVSWQDDSFEMLPGDLRRLYEVLWSVHNSECSRATGGSPR